MKMTLSHRYLNTNLSLLDSLGFPTAMALETLGIDESRLKLSLERMDLDRFVDCLNAAADYTSDPNIALRLGHKFRVGNFGQTGSLYSYCKTLDEIIQMNNRYQKIAIDVGSVESVVDKSGQYRMFFRPYYDDLEKYRPITDMIMATYMTSYNWLTWGSGEGVLSTHLPYDCPQDISAHQEIFRSDFVFGSDEIFMEFSAETASHILTTHDPEKLAQAKVKLDKILGMQMDAHAFEEAVEAAIRGALSTGQISTHIVAERLGMSWSILRTRLNETGEGFRPRLDRIRKLKFMEDYQAGKSFAQIAMSLAYNDQPAMNRAFKRWFGMTPSQWRKMQSDKAP